METAPIRISMIAAMAQNRVIGDGNAMPWHIPEDLKLFKRLTLGKPVIMGRKTFDSIGRPLPGRANIVITRNPDWSHPGVDTTRTPDDALALALEKARISGLDEVIVMGGATIYQQLLTKADRIYLTHIGKAFKGMALFPELASKDWKIAAEEPLETKENYGFDVIFRQYDRAR